MTENEATREMTFEEEYEILQKEKEELFSMEICDSEPPFANRVVRRALRCIRKLLEEIQQYRAIEYDLKERYHANVDIKLLMHHFIETVFEGEKHEGFCLLTNEDADMWNAYKAIGTIEEFKVLKEKNFFNTDSSVVDVDKKSYDRAIDEFASKMKWEYENSTGVTKKEIEFAKAVIDMVAERMKGGAIDE